MIIYFPYLTTSANYILNYTKLRLLDNVCSIVIFSKSQWTHCLRQSHLSSLSSSWSAILFTEIKFSDNYVFFIMPSQTKFGGYRSQLTAGWMVGWLVGLSVCLLPNNSWYFVAQAIAWHMFLSNGLSSAEFWAFELGVFKLYSNTYRWYFLAQTTYTFLKILQRNSGDHSSL